MRKMKLLTAIATLALTATGLFANEAKFPFSGFPSGYQVKNGSASAMSVVNTDGGKALQFKSDVFTYVRLRSSFQTLKANTKYMISYEIKLTNFKSKKEKHPDGVRFEFVSSKGKPYQWINVTGSGSSEGWIKGMIPIDTGARPAFLKSRLRIMFFHVSGTVLLRNLKIEKATADDPTEPSFNVGGTVVKRKVLFL